MANAENTTIELGEFVQMGIYDINEDGIAEPIKWRCVAFEKVTGADENSNPIIGSAQTSMKYRVSKAYALGQLEGYETAGYIKIKFSLDKLFLLCYNIS